MMKGKQMSFANLDDVQKLNGGTCNFTFEEVAYRGVVHKVSYVPVGPGAINVELVSLQPVTEGPAVPDLPLNFTFSLFLAEVTNRPRELVIKQFVPQEGFGNVISFRVKD